MKSFTFVQDDKRPTIIFEDQDLLVLNKPSGMTVNKADTTKNEETVQDWVEAKFKIQDVRFKHTTSLLTNNSSLSKQNDPNDSDIKIQYDPVQEFYNRGGIVHRLDKETSGILLVAKNPESFAKLKQQFMERTVKKTYLALSHGKISPQVGEISVPVGRLEFNRKRFGVVAGGRESVTRYHVILIFKFSSSKYDNKNGEVLSLVELEPQTGRTHQIRVHLKHINHPIFADLLYAGRKTSRNDRKYLSRLFLHAHKISFTHPTRGEHMEFESPLPEDLQEFIANLQIIQ